MHVWFNLVCRHVVLQEVDNMSASEARRRLEAFRKKQQAAAAAKQQQQQPPGNAAGAVPGSSSDTEAAAAAAAASVSFEGAISEAFGDSLKYYVAEEQKEVGRLDRTDCLQCAHKTTRLSHCIGWQRCTAQATGMLGPNQQQAWWRHFAVGSTARLCCVARCIACCLQLLKHLDGLIREEAERAWKPPEGQESSMVLGSANQLFLKIRASLNRCVKLVSRGNTLLRLSGAFKVQTCWQRGMRGW